MKLSKVRVQNYKCIEDSGTWVVDKTTCLVGKNEAGKSALLEALYKLNPVTEDPQGLTPTEYPRRRRVRNRESKVSDANVITTHWNLEEQDLALLRDNFSEITFGPDIEVVVKKGYSNEQKWFVAGIEEQEADVVRQLIDSQRLNAVEKAPIAKCETLAGLSENNPASRRTHGQAKQHSTTDPAELPRQFHQCGNRERSEATASVLCIFSGLRAAARKSGD